MSNDPVDVFKHINMHDGNPLLCWEWKKKLPEGKRPYFDVSGVRKAAYRIVYEQYHGVTLKKSQLVRHDCDNPICCNPHHLSVGTHQDNMDDMKERERHGLPAHVVKAIRRLRNDGKTQKEIAELYGVSRETISAIDTERVYKGDKT